MDNIAISSVPPGSSSAADSLPGGGWVLCKAAAFVAVTDFLLWPAVWGLSFGLWTVALLFALFLSRRSPGAWRGRPLLLAGLLVATAVQSAVEISFSNGVVALALVTGIMGETAFPMLPKGWARCSEALWALFKAPGRWFWAGGVLTRMTWAKRGVSGNIVRGLRIGFPAVLMLTVFVILFSSGNAIFGRWMELLLDGVWRWLTRFEINVPHLFFYGFFATFALAVLRPALPGGGARIWTKPVPRFPVLDASIAWWRSVVMLAALNALFFAVNTIDAFYLWTRGKIPPSVNPTQYVHEGVASLIVAVVLSALLLAGLFQQAPEVSRSRGLKRLGYLWILQNAILIANVAHRLARYVETSQLTPRRIYVGFFLLLVAVGFLLLTLHIARGTALNRLILRNGIATLALFFVVQFLDVAGWVARFNVARWEEDAKAHPLDVGYLATLGPSAWPALLRVANTRGTEGHAARQHLKAAGDLELGQRQTGWRSWQGRRAANLGVLRRFQ